MALYTVCATTQERTARPCAMIDAPSDAGAAGEAERMRARRELDFLPEEARLAVRRASRREIEALYAFMPVQPVKGPAAKDGGLTRRAARMRRAFYEKLWLGELPGRAD